MKSFPRKGGFNAHLHSDGATCWHGDHSLVMKDPSIPKCTFHFMSKWENCGCLKIANSLDPDETPSNSASYRDPNCLILTGLCIFKKWWENQLYNHKTRIYSKQYPVVKNADSRRNPDIRIILNKSSDLGNSREMADLYCCICYSIKT